jgi:phage terminase small subunit
MDATLTRRQEAFIAALLSCPTIAHAARMAGIAEVTAGRWLKDHSFQAAYREARRQVVQQAIVQVQHATGTAVQTLVAVMQDNESPSNARVTAARTILEMAIRTVEFEDLESRIVALEQQAKP